MDSSADHAADARQAVAGMTVAEKASLCAGADFWRTRAVPRVGVPAILMTDGPHGVRLQQGDTAQAGIDDAVPATCFPTASALASTWDPALVEEVAAAIAREARGLGVDVVLGPGVNTKRSPLCGRNFEYYSEDPYLTGRMGAAFVRGLQAHGVGACVKHLAANNQEFRRMTIDVVADERSLREVELAGFEHVVQDARPWLVMCAYNRLNGTHASDHTWLLTNVLRGDWGHDGAVVTDWGALHDRLAALEAGCELEMPGTDSGTDEMIVAAVEDGTLDVAVLDRAATRIVELALRASAGRDDAGTPVDHDAHHVLARRVAAEAAVLLVDRGDALPLPVDGVGRVALLGSFATTPRYQGTGSSRMVPTRVDDLHSGLSAMLGASRVLHAAGYGDDGSVDTARLDEAVAMARGADVAVVCVGLPDGYENEGEDRRDLALPPGHDRLVEAVAAVHDRVVVVLSAGAPVALPWVDDVAAVVLGHLGGQASGGAMADVLTGRHGPGGRLAETWPRTLADVPSTPWFPGGPSTVEYREGIHVGYRYHDTVGTDVQFPFGHGLGSAATTWGEPTVDTPSIDDAALHAGATVSVTVPVTNVADVPTTEVVQVYVRDVASTVHRPDRELGGFAKVRLDPGQTRHVTVALDRRAFAYWDDTAGEWRVEGGTFEVLVGASSRDLRGSATVEVDAPPVPAREVPAAHRDPCLPLWVDRADFEAVLGRPVPPNPGFDRPWTRDTPIGATRGSAVGRVFVPAVERRLRASFGDGVAAQALVRSMVEEAPLRTLLMGGVTLDQLDVLVDLLNGRWVAGGRRVLAAVAGRRRMRGRR